MLLIWSNILLWIQFPCTVMLSKFLRCIKSIKYIHKCTNKKCKQIFCGFITIYFGNKTIICDTYSKNPFGQLEKGNSLDVTKIYNFFVIVNSRGICYVDFKKNY